MFYREKKKGVGAYFFSAFFRGCKSTIYGSDKFAHTKLRKGYGISKQVFISRSFQDMKHLDIFRGMPSMCDDLLWLSEHASLTRGNSAPTQALNEADDAGLAPAHSRPVHSGEGGYGIQGCLESRQMHTSKIHQCPCLVCQLALFCRAQFPWRTEPTAGVFKKVGVVFGTRDHAISRSNSFPLSLSVCELLQLWLPLAL